MKLKNGFLIKKLYNFLIKLYVFLNVILSSKPFKKYSFLSHESFWNLLTKNLVDLYAIKMHKKIIDFNINNIFSFFLSCSISRCFC